MNRILYSLLFLVCWQSAFSQSKERFSSVRISLVGKEMAALVRLGIETDHGEYYPGKSLTAVLSDSELQRVQVAGFQTEMLIPDLEQYYLDHQYDTETVDFRGADCDQEAPVVPDYPVPANYSYGSMGGFLTYAEMMEELDVMQTLYPQLISKRKICSDTLTTWEGRPVYYVKISDNPEIEEPEQEILYTGLHHAREPLSASQMMFFMWYILENYDIRPDIKAMVDNLEIYFIPCINVDGYLFNEQTSPNGGGLWRKNRRDNGDGTYGVDINRNYGFFWGDFGGSSDETTAQTYRGPDAFSEPETRIMRDFCREHDFGFVLNYHSFGNFLVYPWSYNDSLADSSYVYYSRYFTRENGFRFGTSTQTVGYQVNGSSDDWIQAETGAISITPEVGHSNLGFWPPFNQIMVYNKACLAQNLSMAYSALRFGVASDPGGAKIYGRTGALPIELFRYGLKEGSIEVTLEPLSANIVSAAGTHAFDVPNLKKGVYDFPYELDPSVKNGDPVDFVLATDNGYWVHRDTLHKVFEKFAPALVQAVSDSFSTSAQWIGNWELTTETYHSAPSCVTDSPNGPYLSDFTTYHRYAHTVKIPAQAFNVNLKFFARWSIEEDWDYAWVLATGDDGIQLPLCGLYTETGVNGQAEEPIYDGIQEKWVEECMNLDDYRGQEVQIEFQMVADGSENYDGFYLDDLTLEYSLPVSGAHEISLDGLQLLQNDPNPAAESTVISWTGAMATEKLMLVVRNVLGETVMSLPVTSTSQRVDVRTLDPGLYFYRLEYANGFSASRKMLIQR